MKAGRRSRKSKIYIKYNRVTIGCCNILDNVTASNEWQQFSANNEIVNTFALIGCTVTPLAIEVGKLHLVRM